MLRAKYINSINQVIEFGIDGVYINQSDIRDYEKKYSTNNKKIAYFEKQIFDKSLPIRIVGEDRAEKANRIFEIIDYDVVNSQQGTLWIGDYYLSGYFYGSEKTEYANKKMISITLKYVSDFMWRKEIKKVYFSQSKTQGMNFPHNYPTNYALPDVEIINTNYVDTDFKLTIYGPSNRPEVTIGGHRYFVDVVVPAMSYLTIDSIEKKIYLTDMYGRRTNVFNKRDRDSYVFQKIRPGNNAIDYSKAFTFSCELIEQRSEPKWI